MTSDNTLSQTKHTIETITVNIVLGIAAVVLAFSSLLMAMFAGKFYGPDVTATSRILYFALAVMFSARAHLLVRRAVGELVRGESLRLRICTES